MYAIRSYYAKFALANHPWDEPLQQMQALSQKHSVTLLTPAPGQVLDLASPEASTAWWQPAHTPLVAAPQTAARQDTPNPVEER